MIPATLTSPGDTPERPLSPWCDKYRWRFEAYHPALEVVMPAVRRFVSDVLNHAAQPEVEPYWLTILGPSGVGKTLALKQAFKMLARNEHLWEIPTATGSRMPQCAHIIPGEDLTDWRAAKDYGSYDLIYVEDIGAGAGIDRGAGAVTTSRIAELLQYRTGRWTLLDANMSRRTIEEKIDPRIASRLKRDGSILLQIPDAVPDFNDKVSALMAQVKQRNDKLTHGGE